MNLIHSANSSTTGRKYYRYTSSSSTLQKLWPFASKWLGLAFATGSFFLVEPVPAATPLAWGYGYFGQLGDGNFYLSGPEGVATSVQVSGLTTATAIAGGWYHSLALKSDGTVWTWGNGVTATPVQVSGLTSVTAIASGLWHSLALKSDGTVWAWGRGREGQLGDGNFSDSGTPVQVTGLSSVVMIAAGGSHSLALESDGTVWAWGSGSNGQLGDGNFYGDPNQGAATPVQVTGLTGAVAIAGGYGHSLALKSDGTVWAWGYGEYGQLGDGNFYTTGNRGLATPVQLVGLTSVMAIAGGGSHSLALKSDGTVWAWGNGDHGQLGDGNFYSSSSTPIQVSGLSGIIAIAGGEAHSLALKSDGALWAWGRGYEGQLGDGNFQRVATPVLASGLARPVSAIAAGLRHSLALAREFLILSVTPLSALNQIGTVHTLSATITTDIPTAGTPVPNTPVTFTVISGPNADQNGIGTTDGSGVTTFSYTGLGGVGVDVIQASFVDAQQRIHVSNATKHWVSPATPLAWGYGWYGQLGDGNFYTTGNEGVATPVPVVELTGAVVIAGGEFHSLTLKSDGTVWAWGRGSEGQLGDGNFYTAGNQGVATPVRVSGLTAVTAIEGGYYHSLALKSDGTVWAWGSNSQGQLGGNYLDSAAPVQVSGLTTVTTITCGGFHSLALKSDGTVWAWGSGDYGQTGVRNWNQPKFMPLQVQGLSRVVAIAGGDFHSLALKSDGTVWAWGRGQYGQLGDGNFYTGFQAAAQGSARPVQVSGLTSVTAIAAGEDHNLALKSDGTVWAWGYGQYGQLGDGNFYNTGNFGVATPVQVERLTTVRTITCGGFHSLALKSDGTVWAWGSGWNGQLGDGNFYSTTEHGGVAMPILASSLGQPVSAIAGGSHSLALPAVLASTPPVINCPSDMNVSNDLSQCSAVVNYPAPPVSGGTGNVVVVCNPPSGSVFPYGTTTVTCTATDAASNSATCSFNVTVNDTEPPSTSYLTVQAFQTFPNPLRRVGQFQLFASDNCDPDPLIYIRDSVTGFVAGPFHNGDQVEIAKGPTLTNSQKTPSGGPNSAVLSLEGGARMYSVDSAGNVSPITKVL